MSDETDAASFGGGLSGPTQWIEAEQERRAAGGDVVEEDEPTDVSPLMHHNKDALLSIAEEAGVPVSSSLTKAEIVAAIEAADDGEAS